MDLYTDIVNTCKFQDVVDICRTIQWDLCEKVSPKPGLEIIREYYKSVDETYLAVGFVRNNYRKKYVSDEYKYNLV